MEYFEVKYQNFIVDSFLGATRPPAVRCIPSDYEEIDTFQHLVFLFGQPSISSSHDEKKWIFPIQDTGEIYEIKLRPSFIMFERTRCLEKENAFIAGIKRFFSF
ncbi:unnamed protein product [Caenorhabditis brenneri]